MGVNPVALLGQARPPIARVSGCQEPPQGGIAQTSRTPSRDEGGERVPWMCLVMLQATEPAWPHAAQATVDPTTTRPGDPAHG